MQKIVQLRLRIGKKVMVNRTNYSSIKMIWQNSLMKSLMKRTIYKLLRMFSKVTLHLNSITKYTRKKEGRSLLLISTLVHL